MQPAVGTDRDNGAMATDPQDAVQVVRGLLAPGDVVLTIGAGDVTGCGPLLLKALAGGAG